MKELRKFALLASLLLLMILPRNPVRACDRSDVALDSVVFSGGLYTIYATLCVGGGVEGVDKGAGGDTRDIAFAFYTPGGVPIMISPFTPDTLFGDTTGCPMPGFDIGPWGQPFNSQGTIGYLNTFSCPLAYQCVISTALCGTMHSQCTQFSFTVDVLPDSIRVFGVEGNGNPTAGCYPNPDMLIDFTVLPVSWGTIAATGQGDGFLVSWTTLAESNSDRFEVQRDFEGQFTTIGHLKGAGDSDEMVSYEFFDNHPSKGFNRYRIKQVDFNGTASYSEVVEANYEPRFVAGFAELAPNPTSGPLRVRLYSDASDTLQLSLYDISGKQWMDHKQKVLLGENTLNLDLRDFPVGIYFLRIKNGEKVIDKKIMVI